MCVKVWWRGRPHNNTGVNMSQRERERERERERGSDLVTDDCEGEQTWVDTSINIIVVMLVYY